MDVLREAGCVLLGGHSVVDPQAKFGLSVTGLVKEEEMLANSGARPGDLLILTKPLGTGAVIMAVRAGMAEPGQEAEANRYMATLNRSGAELARKLGSRCATDVTGFGLLGHAMQMARASGVGMRFDSKALPYLDGALDFAGMGLLSGAAYSNRDYVGGEVDFGAAVTQPVQDLMFDPQTSGGMLVCCPAESAPMLAGVLVAGNGVVPAVVGIVTERTDGALIHVD